MVDLHLCRLLQFVKVSGGIAGGGSAPPAFQRAEQARSAEELEKQRRLKALAMDDEGLDKNAESYAEELAKRAVVHRKARRKRKGLVENFRETSASRQMEQEMEEALGSLDFATIEGGLHTARLRDESGATTSNGHVSGTGSSSPANGDGTAVPQAHSPVANGHSRAPPLAPGSGSPGTLSCPSVRLEGLKKRQPPISPLRPAPETDPQTSGVEPPQANPLAEEQPLEKSEAADEDESNNREDGRVSDEEEAEGEGVGEEEEVDRLSDIDDEEVDGYLHTDEEVKMKSIIWEELHKEYLADQESKRAAVEAAEVAHVAAIAAAKDNAVGAEQLEAAEQVCSDACVLFASGLYPGVLIFDEARGAEECLGHCCGGGQLEAASRCAGCVLDYGPFRLRSAPVGVTFRWCNFSMRRGSVKSPGQWGGGRAGMSAVFGSVLPSVFQSLLLM
jgi:hypothetical protein